ncbi:protein HGV2-like isoform X1 [Anneissia japonica]|uniref:protein HGV2-like isoform X1 n=1 Tax=Anneissia japonica TaxID=1529436 RepID=UPI001425896D|nr:protein HGV2-like isoform X1 [Anneissia japonica]
MGENNDKTECSKPIAEEEPATNEPVGAASTSAEEQTGDEGSIDIDADAQLLMAQGKRNLVIGEVVQAVQAFQEASALLAAKYGESAKECGEAYFKYGCALLELARMETGVLGNALDGVPDEASDSEDEGTTEKVAGSNVIESAKSIKGSEREKIFKDVYSALDANSKERKKEKAKKENDCEESEDVEMESTENGKEGDVKVNKEQKEGSKVVATKKQEKEMVEKMEMDKDSIKEDMETEDSISKDTKAKKEGKKKDDEGAGCSKDDDQAGTTDGEAKTDEEGENADDIPNFQLAWEMLELSRVIFLKIDKEAQLKVAQVHLTLGELGMETENYAQSIDDFLKCLAIRVKHLEADSRLLAETHYNLGLVYGLDKQFDKSIESYEKSKAVIEQRIVNLRKEEKETAQGNEKENTDSPLPSTRKEISELEELVPDIIAKIDDAKELMKNADDQAKKAIAAEFGVGPGASSSGFAQSSTSSAPAQQIAVKHAQKTEDSATDITHLVRKKRKPEGNGDANETKKSRNDEATSNENGDATNGHGNGDATNGHANGNGQKAQKEIKQKTVEDVQAAKECSMETA